MTRVLRQELVSEVGAEGVRGSMVDAEVREVRRSRVALLAIAQI